MSRTAATDPLVRQPPERDEDEPLLVRQGSQQHIPGRDAHMAVRVNVLQNIREQQFSRIAVCVSLLFNLPQIIGVIVVLARHWDPEACDKPLALWALIYAIRLSLSLLLALSILHPNQNALSPTFIKTRDALNFIAFIWFILGNWWILNTQTCHQLAPAVYQLCLILLIVNYIVIFLPCILLIAFIPIVCFCLPCLIRVMQMLEVQRGAEESAIRELPSTEYHRGMFAEDNLECAICLSTYEEGEQIRQLSCHPRHHFHKTCIDDWLRINDSCPTCRAPIVASSQHPTDPTHEQQSQRVAGMV